MQSSIIRNSFRLTIICFLAGFSVIQGEPKVIDLEGNIHTDSHNSAVVNKARMPRGAMITIGRRINLWPNREFVYDFSPGAPSGKIPMLENQVFPHISSRTCIKFVRRNSTDFRHEHFAIFKWENAGCLSQEIGRRGLDQYINLQAFCGFHDAVHEVLHALGFWHEHARPDRDKYIRILTDNIKPDSKSQFHRRPFGSTDAFGSYYDLKSIMHYRPNNVMGLPSSGDEHLPTYEVLRPYSPLTTKVEDIAMYHNMSYQDSYQVQRLYDCCNIPWNYNSSLEYIPYVRPERNVDLKFDNFSPESNTSQAQIQKQSFKNANDKKQENVKSKLSAQLSISLAHSICIEYSQFARTNKIQKPISSSISSRISQKSLRSKSTIRWRKCSSRIQNRQKSNCSAFRRFSFSPRAKRDPGEFGNHFQGDMFEYDPNDGTTNSQLWPKTIPYVFAEHMNNKEKRIVSRAMVEIQLKTCLKFLAVPPTFGLHHILISVNDVGCFSHVGFNSSRFTNRINLNRRGCLPHHGTILHEFFHVLGMHHENQKPTRNNYMQVNLQSMQLDRRHEFTARQTEHKTIRDFPVDLESIMTLPGNVFALNPHFQTLSPLYPERFDGKLMGQRERMTQMDLAKITQLYKCCLNFDPPDV